MCQVLQPDNRDDDIYFMIPSDEEAKEIPSPYPVVESMYDSRHRVVSHDPSSQSLASSFLELNFNKFRDFESSSIQVIIQY